MCCPALADNSVINAGYLPQYHDLYSENTEKIENIDDKI